MPGLFSPGQADTPMPSVSAFSGPQRYRVHLLAVITKNCAAIIHKIKVSTESIQKAKSKSGTIKNALNSFYVILEIAVFFVIYCKKLPVTVVF